VAFEKPAHEWPHPWRYGTAVVNGVAWTFLWFGLEGLHAPALVFVAATAILIAPVLAFLARSWPDWFSVTGAAVATALLLTYALLPLPAADLPRLFIGALRAWVPVLLVDSALFAVRRRWGGI